MLAPSCFGDGVARQAGGVSRRVPPCVVGMEACCGAHHLGRVFAAQGHEVRLMAPGVRPAVREGAEERRPRRRGDRRGGDAADDAVRGAEVGGAARPADAAPGAVAAGERATRLMNQLRAILLERGITVAKGRRALGLALGRCSTRGSGLSRGADAPRGDAPRVGRARRPHRGARPGVRRDGASSAPARRLATIPGIGALNATALTAAVGEAEDFASARDLAAWLGLVPRQTTTGGKARLGGITKRGNVYLRTLLIHGARAALPGLSRGETPLGAWLRETARARPSQRRRGGAGGEARADRLGGAAQRRRLRPARRATPEPRNRPAPTAHGSKDLQVVTEMA